MGFREYAMDMLGHDSAIGSIHDLLILLGIFATLVALAVICL